MRYINKVGIELEGGWNTPPPDASVGHDGSVKVAAYYVGEVASPPLDPKDVDEWVMRNHPHATNETCGTHVHVSLKRVLDYARLADRETARKFIIRKLRNWGQKNRWGRVRADHPFWGRLSGDNIYCKALWIPQVQIPCTNKPESRRTQLNFCWSVHGTVELRVLPGFKIPEVTPDAIKVSIAAFDDYVGMVSRNREKKYSTELDEDDADILSFDQEADIRPAPMVAFSDESDFRPTNGTLSFETEYNF